MKEHNHKQADTNINTVPQTLPRVPAKTNIHKNVFLKEKNPFAHQRHNFVDESLLTQSQWLGLSVIKILAYQRLDS